MLRILLVEDEPLIAYDTQTHLSKLDFRVTIAQSGEHALEIIRQMQFFDCILMDIDLGAGITGIEAARKIDDVCDTPVVFLSGHTEAQLINEAEGISSYGYVVKHSNMAVLNASIHMAIRLHRSQIQNQANFERMERIMDAAPIGMILVNNQNRILYTNKLARSQYPHDAKDPPVRAGEFLRCPHPVMNDHHICGSEEHCESCQLNQKIQESLRSRRLQEEHSISMNLLEHSKLATKKFIITTTYMDVEGSPAVLLTLYPQDAPQEKASQTSILETMKDITHHPSILSAFTNEYFEVQWANQNLLARSNSPLISGKPIHISGLFYPAGGAAVFNSMIASVNRSGELDIPRLECRTADGTPYWIKMQVREMPGASNKNFVFIATDISAERTLEQSIIHRELPLQDLATPRDAAFAILGKDTNIRYITPGFIDLTGYGEDFSMGIGIPEFLKRVAPDDRAILSDCLESSLREKPRSIKYTFRYRPGYGGYIWRRDSMQMYYRNGEFIEAFLIASKVEQPEQQRFDFSVEH